MKNFMPLLFALVIIVGCQESQKPVFKKEYIHPASGYSQVVKVTTNDAITIYVSGQIGAGDDLETQMENALKNLKDELTSAGATYKDIIKMNTYIVDYQPEDLATFRDTRKRIMGDDDMPASTLVGVSALALPEWKIEIEAIAMLPK